MSRTLGFVGLVLAFAIGAWIYIEHVKSASPDGANPKGAVDTVGVRGDLNAIANAERRRMASGMKCVSLDELRAGGDITLASNSRGPWRYTVEITETGFRVVATWTGPDRAGPKVLSIDESMQITEQ